MIFFRDAVSFGFLILQYIADIASSPWLWMYKPREYLILKALYVFPIGWIREFTLRSLIRTCYTFGLLIRRINLCIVSKAHEWLGKRWMNWGIWLTSKNVTNKSNRQITNIFFRMGILVLIQFVNAKWGKEIRQLFCNKGIWTIQWMNFMHLKGGDGNPIPDVRR